MKYIASCSFGKDSLAMVLKLLELQLPLDHIVFYDTGMEFKAIYNNLEKLEKSIPVPVTVVKPKMDFLMQMLVRPVRNCHHYGYEWCGGGSMGNSR